MMDVTKSQVAHACWLQFPCTYHADLFFGPQSGRKRVYHFYLPIFFYVEQQLAHHRSSRQQNDLPPRPLVFGISAPQVPPVELHPAAGLFGTIINVHMARQSTRSRVWINASMIAFIVSDVQHFFSDGNLVGGQGSGKSTLVEQLVALLKHTGKAAVDVSIDDFYLRFQVPADSLCRRLCTCVHNRACSMARPQIFCVSACVHCCESARGAPTALSGY